jgi:hypothetical protein
MRTFRLVILRPLRSDRNLHYCQPRSTPAESAQTGPVQLVIPAGFQRELLHEEVYSWSPSEDVWGGLPDEVLRTKLKELLYGTFHPETPRERRSVEALEVVLQELEGAVKGLVEEGWMDCDQTVEDNESDEACLRAFPALALMHQLRWILETFRDVPELSVTVR